MIAREDFEGLDLAASRRKVELYRADRAGEPVTIELQAAKRPPAPRRRADATATSRASASRRRRALADVKPNEVPRLPVEQRVYVEDPATPAPGADAFRWFFYASSPPWTNTRHSLINVRAPQKEFLVKLRNVYSFFTIYANIDGFDPARHRRRTRASRARRSLDARASSR